MMFEYGMTQWVVGNEPLRRSCERLKACGYDLKARYTPAYLLSLLTELSLLGQHGDGVNHIAVL